MESKLRDMYVKEVLVYVSENFNNDVKHNIDELVKYIIPYINSLDFNVDEAVQLLEKCPKLIETISEFRKENNKFNRESALLNAYYLITKNDIELDKYDDLSNIDNFLSDVYYGEKGSYMNDIDYVKVYLKEISKFNVLSKEEIRDLFIKYSTAEGEEKYLIREKIINHNLRWAAKIAKRYIGRGVEYLDLIEQGNLGLMRAVEKYQYKLGYTFATYATWWIKQSITRYIGEYSRAVRLPVHYDAELNKYDRYKRIMAMELGREPKKEELAKELKVDIEKIYEYEKNLQSILYLDMQINSDEGKDDMTFGDMLTSEDNEIDKVSDLLLIEEIKADILKDPKLSDRDKDIFFLRCCYEGDKPPSLNEVGLKYNITRERVRQLEAKALRRLRNKYRRNKKFKELFNNGPSLNLKR